MPSTVYKKQSPNAKLTLYLGTRELIVDNGEASPIDGAILIDPSYVKERKVFALVILTFRYGREDEEVMGLKFYTEAVLDFKQIYPPPEPFDHDDLSPLQQNLLRRLGNNAYPLTMEVSSQAPASVRLQPARAYSGSPLGVSYDLKVFVGERLDDRSHKRSSIRMGLRCIHYTPTQAFNPMTHPTASVRKNFAFSPGRLDVEVKLDREIYQHGDTLRVHVTLNNNSIKTVQKIKLYVVQHVLVCMFTNGHFKNLVGNAETDKKHPIPAGASISRDFAIKLMSYLKYPVALAVESGLQEDIPILASTTSTTGPREKNPYGVVVSYEVKAKIVLGCIDRSIVVRLPFKILKSRPLDDQARNGYEATQTSQQKTVSIDIIEADPMIAEQIAKFASLRS